MVNGGLDCFCFPTYGNQQNGHTDMTAVIGYAGETLQIPMEGRPMDLLLNDAYIIVLREKGEENHYRFVDVERGRLSYDTNNPPLVSVRDALEWKSRFRNKMFPYAGGYEFHAIMRYCPTTMDWIRSYMPMKRSRITSEMRKEVYAMFGGRCAYCGKEISLSEMQVDHVESHYRHQGRDEIENYMPACRDCNGLKSDYLLEEFRTVLIPNCAKAVGSYGKNASRAARIAKAYGLNRFAKKKIVFYFEKGLVDD